jgi:carnitine-CoA ligase
VDDLREAGERAEQVSGTPRVSILDAIPFEERTFPAVLRRAVREFGDRTFVVVGANSITYGAFHDAVSQAAGALTALGVQRGHVVVLMLGTRIDFPVLWWAVASLGATAAVIHPEARGDYLRHMLEVAGSRLLVVESALLQGCIADFDAGRTFDRLLTIGDATSESRFPRWEDVFAGASHAPFADVTPADASTIMFTSGTTGRSKGVLRSHHFDFLYAALSVDGQQVDRSAIFWSPSPMSHARTASCQVFASMLTGAKVVLAERFSVSRFWADVRAAGATHTHLSSAMLNLIARAAPTPDDRRHSLQVVHCVPPPDDPAAMEARFGFRMSVQGYGMTEVYPFPQQIDRQDWSLPANCIGRPHPLMEVRIADDFGRPVTADKATKGEILVRPRIPLAMLTGYYGNPAATAEAFRDAWFHTGDLATIDAEGRVYLAGRKKDSIRRRGENVSAVEVEEAAMANTAVAEAAAYGVASEHGEEDVKLDVVIAQGHRLAAAELAEFLTRKLPRFAWPRFIEILEEMPHTPTHKIMKALLRERGITPAAYDSEAALHRRHECT